MSSIPRTQLPTPPKSTTKQNYLIAYNAVSAFLWFSVLARVVTLTPIVGPRNVFGGVDEFVRWVQTLAVMEVAHAAFGIVRAPLLTTLMQVSSRLLLVWGIAYPFPSSTSASIAFPSMLLAWSITEVIRYTYFVFALRNNGSVPSVLTWLRYNTFYVLYPLGITSECTLVYKAIEPAGREWGKGWAWALWAVLAVYVPGSYILYTHMMKQRSRVMRGKKRAE
ncbi:PTPLA-domain-containing protein [Saccharata proteae CBS 121410]|uniref:Very-long-chain (3R)-3-hydroxyacyl-CoA dehydratase n=1 Tax=Saccharata proteae CBS 121410 TaxID=1314787 RepID=A0A9P4LZ85_9PEZI|nr:PTPLA-domain-containing protein [Saccharata proteae CBS 121410]